MSDQIHEGPECPGPHQSGCPCHEARWREALIEVARRTSIYADLFDHNYDGNNQAIAQVAEVRAEYIVAEDLKEKQP